MKTLTLLLLSLSLSSCAATVGLNDVSRSSVCNTYKCTPADRAAYATLGAADAALGMYIFTRDGFTDRQAPLASAFIISAGFGLIQALTCE